MALEGKKVEKTENPVTMLPIDSFLSEEQI